MNHMKTRHSKSLIYVYYEGEGSEKAYLNFLKTRFRGSAEIKGKKGFYSDIERDLKAQQSMLRRLWDQIGEIWLFFDVDQNTIMEGSEENWIKLDDAIRKINRMAGRKSIRIRLLMTTGCIEYWFLLHFEQVQPPYKTGPEFKKYIENRLKRHIPDYRKSDEQLIRKLAEEGFDQGLINGRWTIESLEKKGAITHGSEESHVYRHRYPETEKCLIISFFFSCYSRMRLILRWIVRRSWAVWLIALRMQQMRRSGHLYIKR